MVDLVTVVVFVVVLVWCTLLCRSVRLRVAVSSGS